MERSLVIAASVNRPLPIEIPVKPDASPTDTRPSVCRVPAPDTVPSASVAPSSVAATVVLGIVSGAVTEWCPAVTAMPSMTVSPVPASV